MDLNNIKSELFKIEDSLSNEIEEISTFIFEHAELGLEEFESSKYLVDKLRKYGFEVEYPCSGIPTAFKAALGDGNAPSIAFVAEYDALPGYGENGEAAHACGHNWIAASTVGAAIVLSKLKEHIPCRIMVIGTPAEETVFSKFDMINEGAFKDVDLAMQLHLEYGTILNITTLATDSWEFSFKGKATHAAAFPHEGINALDAVNLTFAGINALRQHVKSDVRIHGIVSKGGSATNIVPDDCACQFCVRSEKRKYLDEVSKKIINCAKGASLMTGAELKIVRHENPSDELITNPVLRDVTAKNLALTGFNNFKYTDEAPSSSDMGNVSQVVPTMYANIGVLEDVETHNKNFVPYANSDKAKIQLHMAVKALACTAADVFLQETLLEEIKFAFNK